MLTEYTYITDPLYDSTCISGTVLKKMPPGRLMGFRREGVHLVFVWEDGLKGHQKRYHVLTGEFYQEGNP